MAKKIGYGRVSTKGQATNGNSLEDQHSKLVGAGCAEDDIYLEPYTGTTMDRPKLNEALGRLEPGDELVVCKLDRLARTTAEGSTLVRDLVNRGITVNVLNMGRADNTPMGNLMVTILLAFAEYEREMILERTGDGKARKRETDPDWREGRKALEIPDEFYGYQDDVAAGGITVKAACAELGISRSTWYKWCKMEVC